MGSIIWNLEGELGEKRGRVPVSASTLLIVWLKQVIERCLTQTTNPVFSRHLQVLKHRHLYQASKLSKGQAHNHSPIHLSPRVSCCPLWSSVFSSHKRSKCLCEDSGVTINVKDNILQESQMGENNIKISMGISSECLMWLMFSSSLHHLSGSKFIFCLFSPWIGRQNRIGGYSPKNPKGCLREESTLSV